MIFFNPEKLFLVKITYLLHFRALKINLFTEFFFAYLNRDENIIDDFCFFFCQQLLDEQDYIVTCKRL